MKLLGSGGQQLLKEQSEIVENGQVSPRAGGMGPFSTSFNNMIVYSLLRRTAAQHGLLLQSRSVAVRERRDVTNSACSRAAAMPCA